jgi:hypothetical protein
MGAPARCLEVLPGSKRRDSWDKADRHCLNARPQVHTLQEYRGWGGSRRIRDDYEFMQLFAVSMA